MLDGSPHRRTVRVVIAAALLGVAGLTKVTSLVFAPGFVIAALCDRSQPWRTRMQVAVALATGNCGRRRDPNRLEPAPLRSAIRVRIQLVRGDPGTAAAVVSADRVAARPRGAAAVARKVDHSLGARPWCCLSLAPDDSHGWSRRSRPESASQPPLDCCFSRPTSSRRVDMPTDRDISFLIVPLLLLPAAGRDSRWSRGAVAACAAAGAWSRCSRSRFRFLKISRSAPIWGRAPGPLLRPDQASARTSVEQLPRRFHPVRLRAERSRLASRRTARPGSRFLPAPLAAGTTPTAQRRSDSVVAGVVVAGLLADDPFSRVSCALPDCARNRGARPSHSLKRRAGMGRVT